VAALALRCGRERFRGGASAFVAALALRRGRERFRGGASALVEALALAWRRQRFREKDKNYGQLKENVRAGRFFGGSTSLSRITS